jgi:putative oxidoreductase
MTLFHLDTPDRLLVRIAAAAMMVIHGVARAYLGIVDDFGGFLASRGFPAGEVIAWALTVVEIAGGLALAAGHLRRPLASWFAVELALGIILVHRHSGWFVVGAGTGGMEYSVLLIVTFLAVAWRGAPGR